MFHLIRSTPFFGVWEHTRRRQYVLLTFPVLLSSLLALDAARKSWHGLIHR